MSSRRILVTNDDGIDAPGIASLYESLSALGDVTAVGPADNQSGVGRTRNGTVTVRDHPWGYALTGTPADCVAFGLGGGLAGELGSSGGVTDSGDDGAGRADGDSQETSPAPGVGIDDDATERFDAVVSGVNDGPNAGNYVVGRSGTVGAAIEAAFLGVPAVAVSAYHTEEFHPDPENYDFDRPARIARRIVARTLDSGVFESVDLLNVNVPVDAEPTAVRLTHPVSDYGQVVRFENEGDGSAAGSPAEGGGSDADAPVERSVRLVDRSWPHVEGFENPLPEAEAHRDRYPADGDRVAMMDGAVSVSPLSVGHERRDAAALREAVGGVELD